MQGGMKQVASLGPRNRGGTPLVLLPLIGTPTRVYGKKGDGLLDPRDCQKCSHCLAEVCVSESYSAVTPG